MGVVGLWVPFKVFTVQESRFGIFGEESAMEGMLNVQMYFWEVIWMLNPERSRT